MEKRAAVGRTLFVWEGNTKALAEARPRLGPYDKIVTVGWLRKDSQTTDGEIR